MLLDTTSSIDTPERVRLRHRIAGPGRRAVAWGIDATLQAVILLGVGALAMVAGLIRAEGFATGGMLIVVFVLQWFYGAFCESLAAGRTPGKWAVGLRVVAGSGGPARPGQFVLRNLLKGADFLPVMYGVGVVVMACDPRLRRIGDLVAGTLVVDERAGPAFGTVPVRPPVREEERRMMPARVELTREEITAIEELLRRRARLADGRVEELAGMLAPAITASTGVDGGSAERTLVLAYARATGRDRDLDADAPA